jgi:Domain of unknown function (DUF4129)
MASYLDCNKVMHKKILILFITIFTFAQAHAQRNMYEDIDSSVVEKEEEEIVEEKISTITTKPYEEKVVEVAPEEDVAFTKETEIGDTTIQFRNFYLNPDSIYAWKHDKKYAWITNLDSLLRQQKKAFEAAKRNENNGTQNRKRERRTDEGSDEEGIEVPRYNPFENSLGGPIFKIIMWTLAIAFVGFIIFQLFLSKGIFGRGGKKVAAIKEIEEIADDNMENDFDSLYRRAYNAGDMRIAMRYLFLKTLQKLNDAELIQFASDKTNSQYAREIPAAKRNEFAQLALYYEYIWYGNIVVKKETFDEIATTFNNFLNKI